MKGFLHTRSRFIFGLHKREMCCAGQEGYECIGVTGRDLAQEPVKMSQYKYFLFNTFKMYFSDMKKKEMTSFCGTFKGVGLFANVIGRSFALA